MARGDILISTSMFRKENIGCDVQNLSLQTLTRATKSSPVAAMKRTLSIPRPNTKGENQIKVFVVYKTEAVCRLTQVKEGRIFFVNHVGNTPEKVKDASALYKEKVIQNCTSNDQHLAYHGKDSRKNASLPKFNTSAEPFKGNFILHSGNDDDDNCP